MRNIDWSKAPEGTTHSTTHGCVCWYKNDKGVWYYHVGPVTGGSWIPSENTEEWREMHLIARPAAVAWRGPQDGLPPVGTVCLILFNSGDERCGEITYQGIGVGCFRDLKTNTEYTFAHSSVQFSLIQPERDTAIDEMLKVKETICGGNDMARRQMAALYDAGYRKVELK